MILLWRNFHPNSRGPFLAVAGSTLPGEDSTLKSGASDLGRDGSTFKAEAPFPKVDPSTFRVEPATGCIEPSARRVGASGLNADAPRLEAEAAGGKIGAGKAKGFGIAAPLALRKLPSLSRLGGLASGEESRPGRQNISFVPDGTWAVERMKPTVGYFQERRIMRGRLSLFV
jgi:hypothetical protein